MATERTPAVTTEDRSFAKWTSWLAALVGLWVLASPFVPSGSVGSARALWSNVVAGVGILLLSAYGAYAIRTAAERPANSPAELGGWVAALAGLWVAASPFVLSGSVGSAPALWSNVVAGVVALVLAGYVGYDVHSRE